MRNRISGTIFSGSNLLFFVSFLVFMLFAPISHAAEKWTSPKFVKEWEVKEIKPGIEHRIISVTANQNGVFALIKAKDYTFFLPKRFQKKAEKMTEKERREFLLTYVEAKIFSGTAVSKMPKKDQNKIIDFCIRFASNPKKNEDYSQKEREAIFDYIMEYKKWEPEDNQRLAQKLIKEKGKEFFVESTFKNLYNAFKSETIHYRIQRYDFDGNFVSQWGDDNKPKITEDVKKRTKPIYRARTNEEKITEKIDSRDFLFEPSILASDDFGDLYLADYPGNKIIKFDANGNALTIWRIEPGKDKGEYSYLSGSRGMYVAGKKVYVMTEGTNEKGRFVPRVFTFDQNGNLKSQRLQSAPKVPGYFQYVMSGKKIPLKKYDGRVNALAADTDGNLYELAGFYATFGSKVFIYDKNGTLKKSFEPVLKTGFDTDIEVLDPETGKKVEYKDMVLGFSLGFDSSKGAPELGQEFYLLDKIYHTPDGFFWVTFKGQKPFGAVNAIIYDAKGRQKGYWKSEAKIYSDWFRNLPDIAKIKAKEIDYSVAFHGNQLFTGKTIEYREKDQIKSDYGAENVKAVIQRFER